MNEDYEIKIILAGDFNINLTKLDRFHQMDRDLINKIINLGKVRYIKGWTFKHKSNIEGKSESKVDYFIFYNFEEEILVEEEIF